LFYILYCLTKTIGTAESIAIEGSENFKFLKMERSAVIMYTQK